MKEHEIRRHGNVHKIYEKETGQYIAWSNKRKKVADLMSRLEDGYGFAGNTPKYLLSGLRHGIELHDRAQSSAEY